MNHRRDVHPEKRRRCRNDLYGNCDYTSDIGNKGCWWRYRDKPEINTNAAYNTICKICDNKFQTKSQLMEHKLINHESSVPFCTNQTGGGCDFEKCWFRHKVLNLSNEPVKTHEKISSGDEQVFQNNQTNIKPSEMTDLKDILLKAMEMIASVNQKIELVVFKIK